MGNGFIIIINIVKCLYILLMKDDAIFIINIQTSLSLTIPILDFLIVIVKHSAAMASSVNPDQTADWSVVLLFALANLFRVNSVFVYQP